MKNYGKLRGGSNDHGRLHLALIVDNDEAEAIASALQERFLLPEGKQDAPGDRIYTINGGRIYLRFDTRRGFSLIPAIVRWAEAANRRLAVSHWDGDARCEAEYPDAAFYRAVAEAACFFGEATHA